jgi:WD40 repeat protein
VRLWNLANLAEIKQERAFDGSGADVRDVAVSPDNNFVAAVGSDQQLRLWKLADGASVRNTPIAGSANSVAFNNDSKRVAVACEDKLVRVFDVANGALIEQFAGHNDRVLCLAYSADGKSLASGSNDKTSLLHTLAGLRAVAAHQGRINQMTLAGNAAQIATCGDDKVVALWNTADLKQVRKYEGVAAAAKATARGGDSQLLAAGDDRTLRVWNLGSGQPMANVQTPAPITAIAMNADGKKILVSGPDGIVRNYALVQVQGQNQLQLVQEAKGHAQGVTALALLPDGRAAFSTSLDKTIKRWLAAGAAPRFNLTGHQQHIYALAFNADGSKLASASADKTVKLWTTADGKNYATCTGHGAQVYGVVFHPTQEQLATASADKTVRLWNAADGKQLKEFKEGIVDALYSIEFSKDGKRLLSCGLAKTWQSWNVGEDKPAQTVTGHSDHVYRASYNPAGNRIATIGYGGHLFVWDAAAGTSLHNQALPVKAGFSLAYAPDGKELAIATSDNRLLLVTIPAGAQ